MNHRVFGTLSLLFALVVVAGACGSSGKSSGGATSPNARSPGDETPLHWAASSDDVDVAAALIDGSADIEAPDGSIGTPLGNAVGYACWHVAQHLVDQGARVDEPWHAAALGLLSRLVELLGDQPLAGEVSKAFWHACSGGNAAPPSTFSRGAPTSTGFPNTSPALRWTRQLDEGTAERTSSVGSATWAPAQLTRTNEGPAIAGPDGRPSTGQATSTASFMPAV